MLPTQKQQKRGRKKIKKEALLSGILQVLVNGVAWRKIAECGCSYVSCWRYFHEIQRRGKLKLIYQTLSNRKTDIIESAIDTTTVTSFRFKRMVGWDGKHKKNGTKISLFTDRFGLPADVQIDKGSRHDGSFVEKHINNTAGRRRKIINMDMIYSNLTLRRNMRKQGTKINVQTRPGYYTRKVGPKFKFDEEKYKIRFLVERTNAWLKSFWRIRIRREHNPAMFKAFVYLALIIILIRS
jgi:transposase